MEIISLTYSITKNETELANLKKLEKLTVHCNHRGVTNLLSKFDTNDIPIKELTLIQVIDINGFKESVRRLKNLRKLELSEINITYEEIHDIVIWITNLEELSLHHEDIIDEIGREPLNKLKK